MKSCKISWGITAILAVLVVAMAYLFIIRGSTLEANDGRTAILLSVGERDHVLGEMRGLLEAVQGITEGIIAEDYASIAEEATAVGMILTRTEDPAMLAKLPIEFKTNGFAAHSAFDELAQNATEFEDADMVLQELSVILSACTSCHAGYRIGLEEN